MDLVHGDRVFISVIFGPEGDSVWWRRVVHGECVVAGDREEGGGGLRLVREGEEGIQECGRCFLAAGRWSNYAASRRGLLCSTEQDAVVGRSWHDG